MNSLSNISFVLGDLRSFPWGRDCCRFDLVAANPPYRQVGTGRISPDPARAAARHELLGTAHEWAVRLAEALQTVAIVLTDQNLAQSRVIIPKPEYELPAIPARLTAIGYAVAGHFDAALAAWRSGDSGPTTTPSENSERLLARVGVAALALESGADEDLTERGIRGATAAKRLVLRLLLIWAVIIAAMTLYGWTV